jgi:hypothetical protein
MRQKQEKRMTDSAMKPREINCASRNPRSGSLSALKKLTPNRSTAYRSAYAANTTPSLSETARMPLVDGLNCRLLLG